MHWEEGGRVGGMPAPLFTICMINIQFIKVQQLQKRVGNPEPPDPAGFQYCSLLSIIMCLQTNSSPQLRQGVPLVPVAVKALQSMSTGSWWSKYISQILISQAKWITSNTCLLEDAFQVCEQKCHFYSDWNKHRIFFEGTAHCIQNSICSFLRKSWTSLEIKFRSFLWSCHHWVFLNNNIFTIHISILLIFSSNKKISKSFLKLSKCSLEEC